MSGCCRRHRLSVDESALTGESLPVAKNPEFIGADETALGDRINMGYMGTRVTGGSGEGIVVATAEATELGKIQTMVGEAESPQTPMERQLEKLGTQMVYISAGVCVVVAGIGLLRGFGWLEMLKSGVSLAVAAVPEGLPAVATTTLAMGIGNMRKHNVSVRPPGCGRDPGFGAGVLHGQDRHPDHEPHGRGRRPQRRTGLRCHPTASFRRTASSAIPWTARSWCG